MSQYRTGRVLVKNGSSVVIAGTGVDWTSIAAGEWFALRSSNTTTNISSAALQLIGSFSAWASGSTYAFGDRVSYNGVIYVSVLDANTNKNPVTETAYWWPTSGWILNLASPWGAPSGWNREYGIVQDFSDVYNFPLPQPGDVEIPAIVSRAFQLIEDAIQSGGLVADTRRSVAVVNDSITGDTYGMEQISAVQSGDYKALRIFTGNVTNAYIAFGKYTTDTAFTEFGRFSQAGNLSLAGNLTVSGAGPHSFAGNVVPSTNGTKSLGSSGARWSTVETLAVSDSGSNMLSTSGTTVQIANSATWQGVQIYANGSVQATFSTTTTTLAGNLTVSGTVMLSNATPYLFPNTDDKSLTLYGGSGAATWIRVYGSAHATKPSQAEITATTTTVSGNLTVSGIGQSLFGNDGGSSALKIKGSADGLLIVGSPTSADANTSLWIDTAATTYNAGLSLRRNSVEKGAFSVAADGNTYLDYQGTLTLRESAAYGTIGSLTSAGTLTLAGDLTVSGGNVGVGGSPDASQGVRIESSGLSGTTQFGLASLPVFTSGATVEGVAGYFAVRTAAGYTMATGDGVYVATPTPGAGSTITTQRGVYIANQGAVGVTHAYGIDIAAQSGAATTNVGLRNAGTTLLTNDVTISGTNTNFDITVSSNSSWAAQVVNNGATNAHGLFVNIGASSTGVPLRVDVNGTKKFEVDNSGNTTAVGNLTVSGTGFPNATFQRTGFSGGLAIFADDTGPILAPTDNTDSLRFTVGGAQTFTMSTTGALGVPGNLTVSGTGTHTFSGLVLTNQPSAANGANASLFRGAAGTDGTLGAVTLDVGVRPSATGSSRFGYISVGDSAAYRTLYLNSNGTVGGDIATYGNATFAGNLTASGTSHTFGSNAGGSVTTTLRAAAGQLRYFVFSSGGTDRWYMGASSEAESGANAGSPFKIVALSDAGAVLSTPLTILRSTAAASFAGTLTASGSITVTSTDDANITSSAGGTGAAWMNLTSAAVTSQAYGGIIFTDAGTQRWKIGGNGGYAGAAYDINFSTHNGTAMDYRMRLYKSGGLFLGSSGFADPGANNLKVAGTLSAGVTTVTGLNRALNVNDAAGNAEIYFQANAVDKIRIGLTSATNNFRIRDESTGVSVIQYTGSSNTVVSESAWTLSGNLTVNGTGMSIIDGTPGSSNPGSLTLRDVSAMAAGVGGGIVLHGKYTAAGGYAILGSVQAAKVNATEAHYGGKVVIYTRTNGSGSVTLAATFDDSQNTILAGDLTVSGGNMSVGGTPDTAVALGIQSTALSGATQYGLYNRPVFTSGINGSNASVALFQTVTAAASFVATSIDGITIQLPSLGAGSTITTHRGIYINNQGTTGITHAYGIDIAAQTGASTTNVGLRNAGTTYLTGLVGIGTTPLVGRAINIGSTDLAGTQQMGVMSGITGTSSATVAIFGFRSNIGTAASAFTVTGLYGLYVDTPTLGASSAATTSYGIRIENQGHAQVGTAYGIYLSTQANASVVNIALQFQEGITVASGIRWGTDTNLYRSATDTLRTDDDFQVGGSATIYGGSGLTLSNGSTAYLMLLCSGPGGGNFHLKSGVDGHFLIRDHTAGVDVLKIEATTDTTILAKNLKVSESVTGGSIVLSSNTALLDDNGADKLKINPTGEWTAGVYVGSNLEVSTGIVVGAPTGGAKGTGTINTAADIYKNNTAYTNPDYVLEHWATGKIEVFATKYGASQYDGLKSLSDVELIARKHFHLPRFGQKANHGLFSGSDALLATVEESYIYLFDHEHRIKKLEEENEQLRQKVAKLSTVS